MNKKNEPFLIGFFAFGGIALICGLIFLMWHLISIALTCAIILPLTATLFAIKKSWLTDKFSPAFSYSIFGLCLISVFVLFIGRIRYIDFVGPIVLNNYEKTWYEDENDETGQLEEKRGYSYHDKYGKTKSSIIENFLWVMVIGGPILTYVQTKKRYDVLRHTASN